MASMARPCAPIRSRRSATSRRRSPTSSWTAEVGRPSSEEVGRRTERLVLEVGHREAPAVTREGVELAGACALVSSRRTEFAGVAWRVAQSRRFHAGFRWTIRAGIDRMISRARPRGI